jgi:beta-phosphoglucomutase-like phosphatase (HAD superfamily)
MIEQHIFYRPDPNSEVKRPVDGVALDLEGTLTGKKLDVFHWLAHKAVADYFFGLEIDLDDPQTFIDIPHLIGGPDNSVMDDIKNLAIKKNLIPHQMPEITNMLNRKKEVYKGMIYSLPDDQFELNPDFVSFIEELKEQRIPTAIGTLTGADMVYLILAKFKLAHYIELPPVTKLVVFESVDHTKPDPQVYYATAGRMGIIPTHQLGFEDSHHGIKALKIAGSISVGITNGENQVIYDRLKTEGGADEIYPDWKSINQDSQRLLNIKIG